MESIQSGQTLEQVLDSIMTAEEYALIEHSVPYIFELKFGDKEIHYFGSPHVRDYDNPVFDDIKKAFNGANPDVVFVEGINAPGDRVKFNEMVKTATFEEAIDKMGESGFTLKLAVDKDIDWVSPEPTDEDLFSNLLENGFSKEEIFVHQVLHVLPQYKRQMNQHGFEKYAQYFIDKFKKATNWEDFDYSYEYAIKTGEQICGETIDVESDLNIALDLIDPIPREDKKDKQTVLNRISQVSSYFRDRIS